jgi:protein-S-isoprenylcysteine O-methyltransferase Ste14
MSPVVPAKTVASRGASTRNLRLLVGSGDRIALFALPFLLVGLALNIAFPAFFGVGGPPIAVWVAALLVLIAGAAIWAWSATLILTHVPRGRLITTGPFALMKHPLYTGVALLVLPALGVMLNTWLGAAVGCAMYIGSRLFAPAEEARMSATFGAEWDRYRGSVRARWL